MRAPLCVLARLLPGEGPAAVAGHRSRCARCGREDEAAAALAADLAAWSEQVVPAPASLRTGVLAALGEQDAADPRRDLVARMAARYAAAAGLVAAALIALAAGVARRHSRAMG